MKYPMRYFYSILFLALSLSANGQWKLTPYIGVNFNKAKFFDLPVEEAQLNKRPIFTGIEVGSLISYQWSNKWQLSTGIAIAQRGYKAEFSRQSSTVSQNINLELSLTYFDMPVILSYQIWSKNDHRLKVHGGAYLGIGSTGSYQISSTTTQFTDGNGTVVIEENLNLGVGFVQSINPGNVASLSRNQLFARTIRAGFNLGLQYQWQEWLFGLSYLQQISAIRAPIKPKAAALRQAPANKLRTVQLTLGYNIPLSKK